MQHLHEVLQGLPSGDVISCREATALLQQSKFKEGRQLLLQSGAAVVLPPALEAWAAHHSASTCDSHHRQALLWGLQLARNLCAAGETACTLLLQTGLLKTVLSLLDAQQQPGSSESLLISLLH